MSPTNQPVTHGAGPATVGPPLTMQGLAVIALTFVTEPGAGTEVVASWSP